MCGGGSTSVCRTEESVTGFTNEWLLQNKSLLLGKLDFYSGIRGIEYFAIVHFNTIAAFIRYVCAATYFAKCFRALINVSYRHTALFLFLNCDLV